MRGDRAAESRSLSFREAPGRQAPACATTAQTPLRGVVQDKLSAQFGADSLSCTTPRSGVWAVVAQAGAWRPGASRKLRERDSAARSPRMMAASVAVRVAIVSGFLLHAESHAERTF